jgi:hypothetical protein
MGTAIPVLIAVACALLAPATAWAGMPSMRLTDLARLRLQSISFFLVGFFLSAFLVQLLWLADGSVRFVSKDVSREVLRALATPAGGENVAEDWDQ